MADTVPDTRTLITDEDVAAAERAYYGHSGDSETFEADCLRAALTAAACDQRARWVADAYERDAAEWDTEERRQGGGMLLVGAETLRRLAAKYRAGAR